MKKLTMAVKPVISLFLAAFLFTQVYALALTEGTGGSMFSMLQYSSAQSVTQVQDSGNQIKEIEKVTKDLGYSVSPNAIPTSNSLPLEFGVRPGGTMQPVVPGASGVIAVLLFENEDKARAFSKERIDLLTMGRTPILDNRKDGVVWQFDGGGYYGPLNDNKIEYSGGATGEFVCGKVTFSADETIISDPIDYPAGGIRGPDPLSGGGENQNYKNMIAEGAKISKKASDDLAQRLQNIVAALSSRGLCTAAPQPQQQVDQICSTENLLENTPVSSQSTSQNNIKLAAYTSGEWNSHKNHIVNVLDQVPTTTSKTTGPRTYQNDPWKFTYEIVHQEGLVLKDITAGGKLQFKSISIPHLKVDYGPTFEYVRFNAKADCAGPVVVRKDFPKASIDTIQWQFIREFDQEGLKGYLSVYYDIVVRTYKVNNCEKGAGFDCYRFIPKIRFSWSGEPQALKQLTAYYRFDYGKVGYALTGDYNWFPLFLINNLHRQDIVTKETRFIAVDNGKTGKFDNIHTVHENEQVIIPGCARSAPYHFIGGALKWGTYNAFDCQHMHWRWSSSVAPMKVDPMVEPSDDTPISTGRGEPNLAPGQKIEVGILKVDETSERDPDEPLWLIDLKSPKTIATTYTKNDFDRPILPFERPEKTMKSIVGETILWYVASTKESVTKDTFFRHGIFVIDPPKTKKVELEKIRSNLEGMALGDKKTALLSELDAVLQNDNWSPNDMMLSEKNGVAVFTGLSGVANSLLEAKGSSPVISDSVNEALGVLLTTVQDIVNTDVQTRMFNTLAMYPADEPVVAKLFAENGALKLSMEKFDAASNTTDPDKSATIVDDLRQSWESGLQAIQQVSGNLTRVSSASSPAGNGSSSTNDLSGIWTADDGGTYYLSQLGNTVWWHGMSGEEGQSFTNVFRGTIENNRSITGEWTDVPKGATRNNGTLSLEVSSNDSFFKVDQTGGFSGSTWNRVGAGGGGESLNASGSPAPSTGTSGDGVVDNARPSTITNTTASGQQTTTTQEPPTSQQLAKSAKADMIDYENPDFRLTMKYPSNWALKENSDNVVFTSTSENEADPFLESLYVYHQGDIPLFESGDETLEKNIEAAIDFRKSFSNFELLASNIIDFNGNSAGQIEYTYTDPNIGNVNAMEIVVVDGNDKYNIVFIANPEQYSFTLPTAQEMIDSIEITPDEPSTSDQGTDTGEDGDKIDAGSETIVDTFDDPVATGEGDEGDSNAQDEDAEDEVTDDFSGQND